MNALLSVSEEEFFEFKLQFAFYSIISLILESIWLLMEGALPLPKLFHLNFEPPNNAYPWVEMEIPQCL